MLKFNRDMIIKDYSKIRGSITEIIFPSPRPRPSSSGPRPRARENNFGYRSRGFLNNPFILNLKKSWSWEIMCGYSRIWGMITEIISPRPSSRERAPPPKAVEARSADWARSRERGRGEIISVIIPKNSWITALLRICGKNYDEKTQIFDKKYLDFSRKKFFKMWSHYHPSWEGW